MLLPMLGRDGGMFWEVTISGHLLNHLSLTIQFVQMLGKGTFLFITFLNNLNYHKIKKMQK